MSTTTFTQVKAWEASQQLAIEIYGVVGSFPPDERYALTGQIKRAAVSIPANIAEGFGRYKPREKAYFYSISRGSAEELKSLLMLARSLGFLKGSSLLETKLDGICGMLHGLIGATLARLARPQ